MQLHYVFLGIPTLDLIQRIIKTIGLYSGSDAVFGVLCVLDDDRKMIATSMFASIEDRKNIRFLNNETEAAIFELQKYVIPPEIFFPKQDRIFSAGGRLDRMPENLFSLYFAMTQMIFSYLSVLSHPDEALPREFVTGKELFALWLAYTYGGMILDAGCDAFQAWNLASLNPHRHFLHHEYLEKVFSHMVV